MKVCTAVQEGCGYKDTLHTHRCLALLEKYFTVCITYQPPLVNLLHDCRQVAVKWVLDQAGGCVDVKNVRDCKCVDVKCLVFTVSAAWEIIVFIHNATKVLMYGTKRLMDIVIF